MILGVRLNIQTADSYVNAQPISQLWALQDRTHARAIDKIYAVQDVRFPGPTGENRAACRAFLNSPRTFVKT
jgi:hypothetical protein